MEAFEGNYKVYYSVMWFTGLWPYNDSFLLRLYRAAILLMIIGCLVNQLCTMTNSTMTIPEIVVQISFSFTLFLYTARYLTGLVSMEAHRHNISNMQKDHLALKDSIEFDLLLKHSIVGKRVMQLYCGLVCCGTTCLFATLGLSTILQSDLQLRFLHLLGFYFNEKSLRTNLTCWHTIMSVAFGLLASAGMEGSITVYSTYISGLLEIASYRMQNTVNSMANSDALKVINLRPIVEIHCDAVKHSKQYANDMMISSLVIVVGVAAGFGINIYRLYMSVTMQGEFDEVLITLFFVSAYVSFIVANNYCGQIMLDSSHNFYHQTCNTLWYRIPPKMQKMVLLALVRTQVAVEFNLAGLFVPCYEGLTMMMSSSFSYFTLLCSVQ
ncbi:uncharacterized protein LOC143213144 [Lasioglossum baleicum]|uniref:uncharacterized protein LOC143213144 n=1 Tax=Lasioglossum baleicum TaxID=434251 RepID=UPI003FCC72B7